VYLDAGEWGYIGKRILRFCKLRLQWLGYNEMFVCGDTADSVY
jgi:hypothetical protein